MASEANTLSRPVPALGVEASPRGPGALPRLARRLYQFSQRRSSYLPATFFGEPAWYVLLDLYASEAEGRAISVTSASIASGAPQSTGMRVLRTLEQEGFVMRGRVNEDRRRCDVQLTTEGRSAVERTLGALTPMLAG